MNYIMTWNLLWVQSCKKKKNLKLRSDLILYPQSYINNLEIILSIITSSIKTFQTYIIVRTVKKKKHR
jgi:hypothetical protein